MSHAKTSLVNFCIGNEHLIKTTNMMNGFNANMLKPNGF